MSDDVVIYIPDYAVRGLVAMLTREREEINRIADQNGGWGLGCEAAMDVVNAIEEAIPSRFTTKEETPK